MREEGWITKTEAAALLGVDERTIERRARAGRIQSKQRPGFPTVYRAADVEILRQAGRGEVQTGLLETGPARNGNGHGAQLGNSQLQTVADDPIRQLAALVVQALTHGPTGPTGPTTATTGPTVPALFLTLDEAAAYTGLSTWYLRVQIKRGTLPAVRTRGWRIRRKDLEAL